jgi:hypothetical protein
VHPGRRAGTIFSRIPAMQWMRSRCAAALPAAIYAFAANAANPPAVSFDKPSFVKQTPLARDPLTPDQKHDLSCFYFPAFMVKQIDSGEKGAEHLSIVPIADPHQSVACEDVDIRSEIDIDGSDWAGWFKGVKGGYIFFDADDGWNGGMGFAIFNAQSGEKLFDDTAAAAKGDAPSAEFHSLERVGNEIQMKYRRVYAAKCSLLADEAGCWKQIRQDTGLTAAAPPDCRAAYQQQQDRDPARSKQIAALPSVIEYEVDVHVGDTSRSLTPLSPALVCRPPE